MNTIPRELQAQWVKALNVALEWVADDLMHEAAWWLPWAVFPMLCCKGAGKLAPPHLRFLIRTHTDAILRGDWEERWIHLERFIVTDKQRHKANDALMSIFRLVRKRTQSILRPMPADFDEENDAALEHRKHTADVVGRMRGAFQTVTIRGQVNLILGAPV